jgi:hypothetical protein
MSDAEEHDIMKAWGRIVAAAGSRKTKGVSAAQRKAAEKAPVAPTDGRRRRATGRTKQLNVKVKPAFHQELTALAEARGTGIAELLEQMLADWKAAKRR